MASLLIEWSEHPMIAGEVDAGFGDQRCQPCDEIHRFESHLGRSIAVGRLQTAPVAPSLSECPAL